jgi:hypothetical protein
VLAKHVERLLSPWLRTPGAHTLTTALTELQS